MAIGRCDREGETSSGSGVVERGSIADEMRGDRAVSVVGGDYQRRTAVVSDVVDVGASVDQHSRALVDVLLEGETERGFSFFVGDLKRRSISRHQMDHADVLDIHCFQEVFEQSLGWLGLGCRSRGSEEERDVIEASVLRERKGGLSEVVSEIELCSFLDEDLDHVQVALG